MERALGVVKKAQVLGWDEEREVHEMVMGVGWSKELERAVGEVILIVKDRVKKLGLV